LGASSTRNPEELKYLFVGWVKRVRKRRFAKRVRKDKAQPNAGVGLNYVLLRNACANSPTYNITK